MVALVFLGWTLYGVLTANIHYVFGRGLGMKESFWRLVRFELPEDWLWALLTFPILAAAHRLPVTRANWTKRVPAHLALATAVHFLRVGVLWLIEPYVREQRGLEMPFALVGTILLDGFIYVAIVAVVHAASAQGQALRFRNELLEAELRLLRMQLQPHFLFNTLNAVSELARTDPERAEQALVRLGDLLRWSLQSSRLREVALQDELAALETYLEIQRLRHGEGLTFRIQADPDTMELAVPSLLLQPLVENSIRHGMRGGSRGNISILAGREEQALRLVISDDGRGLSSGFREGTGLRTTRARLIGLYGGTHSFRIHPGPGGGTMIEIELPARLAPVVRSAS
jgi:two-component system LytT family sensor kinase